MRLLPRWVRAQWPGLIGSVTVITGVALAAGSVALLRVHGRDVYDLVGALLCIGLVAVPAVGRALVRADRRSPLGWLLVLSGFGVLVKLTLDQYARAVYVHGADLPHPAAAEVVSSFGNLGQLSLGMLVPLFVLDRLPQGRRWRRLLYAAIALLSVDLLGDFAPNFWHFGGDIHNPLGLPGTAGVAAVTAEYFSVVGQNAAYVGAALATGAARRDLTGDSRTTVGADGDSSGAADPSLRSRLRAVTLLRRATWLVAASYLFCLVLGSTSLPIVIVYAGEHFALLVFAVTAWVAVARYRLVDARRVVDRALYYAALSATVLGAYVALVAAGRALIDTRWPSSIAIFVAVVVALPLREWLQRRVARLVWGQATEPALAFGQLAGRLAAAAVPEDTLAAAARTVGEALGLRGVSIALEGRSHPTIWGEGRTDGPATTTVALAFGGQEVGRMTLSLRSGEADLTVRERRLVEDLAPQIAAAGRAVTTSEALVASKDRLVDLRSQERERIRCDLHDGLGPTLAGIALGIGRARDSVGVQPDRAIGALTELGDHARRAVSEVHTLVHNLQPSALAEHGLVQALGHDADRLGVTFAVGDLHPWNRPGLPAPVESAAYRIALEAMTNATRHSSAAEITLRLERVDFAALGDALVVEVTDDGRGIGPHHTPGLGLTSMRARACELGGTFQVSAGPGAPGSPGTVVRAVLPCLGRTARPGGDVVHAEPEGLTVGLGGQW